MKERIIFIGLFMGLLVSPFSQGQNNKSYFKDGKFFFINSSHQDIAWMDTPDVCIKFRDEQMITPALKRLAESPDFCFSVEDALSLREYLERHPEKYNEILKYTKEGRLEWGATYKQPYQSMCDGEALIRQVYYGKKWLHKTLPGCEFKTAWNEDVPGMALQFPQILAKSGIPYYQFSRHAPGFHKWYSPDGSSVLGWTSGQYSEFTHYLKEAKTDEALADTFMVVLNRWEDYFAKRKIAPGYICLYSFDFSVPVNYDKLVEQWNNELRPQKGLPAFQYATSNMAFDYVSKNKKAEFDELQGERPNVWLYIHGPSHHRAVKAGREASRLLASAEKFSTFNAMLENSFSNYPVKLMDEAWEAAIYPDHGWGGKGGVVTDRLFREKYEFARDAGKNMLRESIASIAGKIKFNVDYKKAITVFNALSWERSDPVKFTLDVEGRSNNHFKIVDDKGKEVAYQLTDAHEYTGNRDEVLTFLFVADKVPALGYKTYYLVEEKPSYEFKVPTLDPIYENNYYRIKLGNGGIESLYDKSLGMEYLNASKFSGGELFTMKSVGTGAGEFTDIQQPTMEGFDKLSNYKNNWQCVEAGPVRDVFQTIQVLKDVKSVLRVVMYKNIKRIDVEVDLNQFNGENWREFRLAFPMNMQNAKVSYEVPMGVVEVGKDEIKGAAGFSKPTQIYDTPCKDVHPREVQDWFSVYTGNVGMTISSDVAVFDWVDPTDNPVNYAILQPILLSSRKSCHGGGNYYLQPGNHTYKFSLFTHEGNWKNGYRNGTQARQPMEVVLSNPAVQAGFLPEQYSFVETEGEGIIVSTIKKCEDDDAVVLRCYEMEGKDTELKLKMFDNIRSVEHTNIIEEAPETIKSSGDGFNYKVGHNAIETFKIHRK